MECEECDYSRKVNIEGKPYDMFCKEGGQFIEKDLGLPEWCPKKRGGKKW